MIKVKRIKRQGCKIVQVSMSEPQTLQEEGSGLYYLAYTTMFVIEKWDGNIHIAQSDVDKKLVEVQGSKRKQVAMRKSEEEIFLRAIL